MVNDTRTRIETAEIVLNNVPMRVIGDIGFEITNIYGRKIQQGDPGPDDHPVNSTIPVADQIGGMGTFLFRGEEDRGNCWDSDLWLDTRDYMALHPAATLSTVTGEDASLSWVHDKLGSFQYATFGKKLRRWNETTDAWDDPGSSTSTNTPSGPGITWGDADTAKALYVPMGSSNYEEWSGSAWSAGSEPAIAFAVWSQKLFKLDGSGVVKFTVDGGTTWTTKGVVPREELPQAMFVGYDRSGKQVIHVTTSGGAYSLDFSNAELVETDFRWPDHPTGGKAAAFWRGSSYVAAGLGIHRWAGDLVSPYGPDGKDGLKEEFSLGHINSMIGTYNELVIAVNSGDLAYTPAAETSDAQVSLPEQMYSQLGPIQSQILANNGLGWRRRWRGEKELTNVLASSTSGIYRLFWGSRGGIYTMEIPRGYYNPRYLTTKLPLQRYGRHETPFFNWGSQDTPKVLKQLEVKTEDCDINNYIDVWIRFSEDDNWGDGHTVGTPLAKLVTNPSSQHVLNIGFDIIGDTLMHTGIGHEKVQAAFDLYGDPANVFATPVMKWFTLIGRKWMRPVRVWTFQVDATQAYNAKSTRKIRDAILAAATKKGAVPLVVNSETFMVELTSDDGNIRASLDYSGYVNLTAVESTELGVD